MKRYSIKILFCLIGMFFIFRAGLGFCGWVDRLEDWSRRFHEFEETFMDSTGYWVAREIGGQIVPFLFWEKRLSTFNPIGNALVPIEDQIPGLDIRGKLESVTRFPLHGNSYEGKFPSFDQYNPLTGRTVPCPPSHPLCAESADPDDHADLGLKEASWITNLEFDYKPVPWFRFDTVFAYRYDAAFDWDDRFAKLYTRPNTADGRKDTQAQGYRSLKYIWREAFMTFYKTPWEITLGKQNVAWGKMFTKVMDFIGPDFFGAAIDEEGRQSLWMANFTYWWENWHFQYLFIPDWEERIDNDLEPQSRTRGSRPVPFRAPGLPDLNIGDVRFDKPGNSWKDFQHAFRAGFEYGKWEVDLAYYYAWITDSLIGGGRLSTPTFRRVLGLGRDARGRQVTFIARERQPTRIHFIALSAVRPFYKMYRDWLVRFEGVLVKDYPWSTRSEQFIVGSKGERFDPDGRKKKDQLNLALEVSSLLFRDFDFSITNILSMLLPYDSRLSDNRPAIISKIHNMEHTLEFSVRKKFYGGKCGVSFRWITNTSQGDGQFSQGFDYEISDFLSLDFSFREFYGDWPDSSGRNQSEDWWRLTITYGF